ncbi:Hypothetical predicted protein, partial [Pelobates cultripes]
MTRLRHEQLKHFLSTNPPLSQGHRTHTLYETQCAQHSIQRGHISSFYKQLCRRKDELLPTYTSKWETELGIQMQTKEWYKIFANVFRTSKSNSTHESNYKRIARWHYTPSRIHRFFPNAPNTCW